MAAAQEYCFQLSDHSFKKPDPAQWEFTQLFCDRIVSIKPLIILPGYHKALEEIANTSTFFSETTFGEIPVFTLAAVVFPFFFFYYIFQMELDYGNPWQN